MRGYNAYTNEGYWTPTDLPVRTVELLTQRFYTRLNLKFEEWPWWARWTHDFCVSLFWKLNRLQIKDVVRVQKGV